MSTIFEKGIHENTKQSNIYIPGAVTVSIRGRPGTTTTTPASTVGWRAFPSVVPRRARWAIVETTAIIKAVATAMSTVVPAVSTPSVVVIVVVIALSSHVFHSQNSLV